MTTLANLSWFNAEIFKNSAIYSSSPKRLGSILDHMELRAICNLDKIFSTDDLLDIREDEAAFGGTEAAGNEYDVTVYPQTTTADEMIRLIKTRLKYRQQRWADIWPFNLQVSPRGHCTVTFMRNHRYANTYTYFLLALHSKYIQREQAGNYHNLFEVLCYQVARQLFPESCGWVVKQAGVAANGVAAYVGNKVDKLIAISADLFLPDNSTGRLPTTSGDGGIDLVAFHQLYDNRGKLPVVFMQCACSADIDELERKTWDVCHTRLKAHLNLDVMHEWFLFSPYDWYDQTQPDRFVAVNNDAVIFDRGRILKSIHQLGIEPTLDNNVEQQIIEFISTQEQFS